MSDQITPRKTYHVNVPSCDVSFLARITKAPEMRYTPSGQPVTSINVAVSRRYQKDNEWKEITAFLRLNAWQKLAEGIANMNLTSGDVVIVKAELADLKAQPYESKDGTHKASLEMTIGGLRWVARDPNTSTSPAETPAVTEETVEEENIPF